MSIDRAVFAFAGAVILISLGLSQLHHSTAFCAILAAASLTGASDAAAPAAQARLRMTTVRLDSARH